MQAGLHVADGHRSSFTTSWRFRIVKAGSSARAPTASGCQGIRLARRV
jgi:hypothetical protein